MYIRYLIVASVVLIAKLLVYVIAPFVALIDRDWLPWWLRWVQTFDGKTSSYWTSGKADWLRARGWVWGQWRTRYVCRLLWYWRNPAYWLALNLGFNQAGRAEISDDDPNDKKWENVKDNRNVWLTRKYKNKYGDVGFLYRGRFFITQRLYFQTVLGYKNTGNEQNAMVAIRIPVFRIFKE